MTDKLQEIVDLVEAARRYEREEPVTGDNFLRKWFGDPGPEVLPELPGDRWRRWDVR